MSLVESVNQLAAEVAGLAGRVVRLNNDVAHMAETYVPRDEAEEREKQTVKVIRTIVIAAALVIVAIIGGFAWLEWQGDKDRRTADRFGAIVVSCIVAAQDEMRQAMDEHFKQTAEFTQRPVPPEAPTNGITREDVVRLCEPVRPLLTQVPGQLPPDPSKVIPPKKEGD